MHLFHKDGERSLKYLNRNRTINLKVYTQSVLPDVNNSLGAITLKHVFQSIFQPNRSIRENRMYACMYAPF